MFRIYRIAALALALVLLFPIGTDANIRTYAAACALCESERTKGAVSTAASGISTTSSRARDAISQKIGDVSAQCAVLMNVSDGKRQILWQKNADRRMRPASTTKIMTAIVAIEAMPLSSVITVPAEAVGTEGSSVYLTEGEKFTLEELLYCMLLASANDAAATIAVAVGGSIAAFADMMNDKASMLGLESSHFANPHGLDDEAHYTSAKDLALIAAYALENDVLLKIVSTYKIVVKGVEAKERRLVNHNRLLLSYRGAVGVKTGYTKAGGRCLVSAAERDGLRLVCVTLSAPDDWQDHKTMLDSGFSSYERVALAKDGKVVATTLEHEIPALAVIGGEQTSLVCRVDDAYAVVPTSGAVLTYTIEMQRYGFAPIEKGTKVGKITWYCDGEAIASSDVKVAFSAAKRRSKKTFAHFLRSCTQ